MPRTNVHGMLLCDVGFMVAALLQLESVLRVCSSSVFVEAAPSARRIVSEGYTTATASYTRRCMNCDSECSFACYSLLPTPCLRGDIVQWQSLEHPMELQLNGYAHLLLLLFTSS